MTQRSQISNIFKGGFANLISSTITKFFVFFVNILTARFSTPEAYGIFALTRSAIISLETIISSALTPIYIKKAAIDQSPNSNLAIVFSGIIISLFISSLLYLYSILISPHNSLNFSLSSSWLLFLFFLLLGSLINSIFISNKLYVSMIASNILALIISLSIFVSYKGINFNENTELLFEAYFCVDSIFKILYLLKIKKIQLKIKNSFMEVVAVSSISTSGKMLIASLLNTLAFFSVRYNLGSDGGMQELANFDVAYQYMSIAIIIQNSFAAALLSNYISTKDDLKKRATYKKSSQYLIVLAVMLALFLSLFAPFSRYIFGSNYDFGPIFGVAITIPFFTIALLFNRLMVARGKESIVALAAIIPSLYLYLMSIIFKPNANELSYFFASYYAVSSFVYVIYIFGNKLNDNSAC